MRAPKLQLASELRCASGAFDPPPAICLMGPTGVGKTQLAIEIVRRFPCEIISVDSAMIYRGMDIGTAKPAPKTLARAPHRLIDFLDPSETYSAAQFRKNALAEMAAIHRSGKIPLLVGGTMLYFRVLERGLSELPSADRRVRKRIEAQAQRHGWATLHRRLEEVDPTAAARIHPHDPQRLQRALEVYELTSVPMSALYAQRRSGGLRYRLLKLGLLPADRHALRERIALRFHRMLDRGLIREVEALYERGDLNPTMPSMRAVGYRQVWDFLDGHLDYDNMVTKAITATRQLAKRQLTWLRADSDATGLHMANDAVSQIVKVIGAHLR